MKERIKNSIQKFDLSNFYESSLNFFNSLGYDSDKRSKLETPNFDNFTDQFRIDEENINKEKALVSHWEKIQFLFQLSTDEISNYEQLSMFHSNKVNTSKLFLQSYLFISIALKNEKYTKTDLVNITRQINKQFLQPVLILFHYNEMLCLSVIDRRMNKKDSDKDVLEKVTLIKDIRIDKPHRAHIEILNDLHLSNLNVNNFDQLHKAFKIVLNTKELNKRFYIELSNWYFRAMNVCEFPNEIDEKNIKEISLIRFISRILFAWFLKEKGLIPDEIFTQEFYDDVIKHDTSMNSSRYYKAVLQNLFFATLNSKLPDRNFQEESANFYNKQYMVFNKYRYKDYLKSPENFLDFFKKVPFLNGGLFDCLDFEDDNKKRVCVDCFSNNEKFRAKLIFPDSLFFQTDTLDFSALYNDKRKNRVAVKGLFDIFNEYKFTIDENTPLEQEIALDPELLGQTLENLLASYNPETQATARKSTGSYYTPREIVDYMVDESLIAYLTQYLKDNDETLKDMDSLCDLLRDTFSYTEKSHPFSKQEVETIIDAVFKLKMLDPACGSGAFPMGILLKMVYVLERIDPENKVWKKKLLENIPDEMKNYIEVNTDNFSRKLGLIWNCIYGVDIQTIAIQLTKLRFFISLIVEENVDWNNKDNFGILPLPNLETKFVAANTLIGIERPEQMLLGDDQREEIEKKIKSNRLEYFNANSRREKKRIKVNDKKLRTELAEAMKFSGFDDEVANKIASWEPYDINHSADWFDPEYMFMVTDGFDILIGNPPYIESRSPNFSDNMKTMYQNAVKQRHPKDLSQLITRGADLLVYFFERSITLVNDVGFITMITQNSWLDTDFGKKFQHYLLKSTHVEVIIDSDYKHFDSQDGPNINTVITIFQGNKVLGKDTYFAKYHIPFSEVSLGYNSVSLNKVIANIYKINPRIEPYCSYKWGQYFYFDSVIIDLLAKMKIKGTKLKQLNFSVGQGLNLKREFIIPSSKINEYPNERISPILTSKDDSPFMIEKTKNYCRILTPIKKEPPVLILPRGLGRHFCCLNKVQAYSSSFVDIYADKSYNQIQLLNLWLFMNSSVFWLLREIKGRKNLGGGMLKAEATDIKDLYLYYSFENDEKIKLILESLSKRRTLPTLLEIETIEHKLIDEIVFEHLAISDEQRNDIVFKLKDIIKLRQSKSKRHKND